MARFPCALHQGRFTGPAAYWYPAVLSGSDSVRARLRVCTACSETMLAFVDKALDETTGETDVEQEFEALCAWCSLPVGSPRNAAFVTAYPVRDQRRDWFGVVHLDCTAALADALHLPDGP